MTEPTTVNEAMIRAELIRHWSDPDDQDQIHEIYHDDLVLDFPQSGERIVGFANVKAMREAYPAKLTFTIQRMWNSGDLWVTELVLTYDGGAPVHAVNIMEFRGDKVARETIYFGDPWERPAWRAPWVEGVTAPLSGLALTSTETTRTMTDREIREALTQHLAHPEDRELHDAIRHEDLVLEFPQSGERIVGLARVRAMREAYPADVAFAIERIRNSGDLWVLEVVTTYDGASPLHGVAIMEFRDGKIGRETIYAGEPWEPPAWRAPWVERTAPATVASASA